MNSKHWVRILDRLQGYPMQKYLVPEEFTIRLSEDKKVFHRIPRGLYGVLIISRSEDLYYFVTLNPRTGNPVRLGRGLGWALSGDALREVLGTKNLITDEVG